MTVTVRVTCLNGHSSMMSLGFPNLQTFIQGHNTKFWEKCPECGKLPLILRAGRYERDEAGVMQRTSDCRPW
jgi:ssDNA-binding Zn-finger/Zn-ribbon topoisomerase 1